ncbi:hypothetical protein VFPPC_17862 [Pochonia chlamydosporia 170]|uniref:Uncharacterized protein n=1 Tax=Pochonia chlamydosporia 170 TaxID=1380566 RepID=A0A219ARW5_METCM|nr:hypothetical protein VFPPC_17862 [Pochonia chlamydosporia 170]OWT42945.1 hypothetical protein VFPPC_17862 [Pochonia chlamydosporia 170]
MFYSPLSSVGELGSKAAATRKRRGFIDQTLCGQTDRWSSVRLGVSGLVWSFESGFRDGGSLDYIVALEHRVWFNLEANLFLPIPSSMLSAVWSCKITASECCFVSSLFAFLFSFKSASTSAARASGRTN